MSSPSVEASRRLYLARSCRVPSPHRLLRTSVRPTTATGRHFANDVCRLSWGPCLTRGSSQKEDPTVSCPASRRSVGQATGCRIIRVASVFGRDITTISFGIRTAAVPMTPYVAQNFLSRFRSIYDTNRSSRFALRSGPTFPPAFYEHIRASRLLTDLARSTEPASSRRRTINHLPAHSPSLRAPRSRRPPYELLYSGGSARSSDKTAPRYEIQRCRGVHGTFERTQKNSLSEPG